MCNNQNCGCESDCEDNCQCQILEPKKSEVKIGEITQSDWITFMMTPP